MGGQEISIVVAFTAGVLSFLSPCVLPLVPIYLGYLTGQTSVSSAPSRQTTLSHAAAFVFGFGGVFVILGASVGLIGYLLLDALPTLIRVGGILLIIMGLHLAGVIRIPFLYIEKRLELQRTESPTLWSSVVVGMIFAAGWTPCVGPVLSGILGLAAFSGTAFQGAFLLAVYSLGLGVPFLLAALGLGSLTRSIRRLGPYLRYVEMTTGALLVIIGVLLFFDQFARLNAYFLRFTPTWLFERL
ncbi:MAG: cytochrome c biogenesis protein CcdA [Ardenticatenaceae bacterium]|nr:cytochrome c biogenesis protein CcdA [Ardenticatenaceae bacterium]HBY94240.1 cytochrome C biogenesis protein [Chloroflexota bacterium]